MAPHPLSALSLDETNLARDIVKDSYSDVVIQFRQILLHEPPKSQVTAFLDLEHAGKVTEETPRPSRLALATYDVIGASQFPEYHESIIDLKDKKRVGHEVVSSDTHHGSLAIHEFDTLVQVVQDSPLFQAKIKELGLPEHFEVVVEPWPYGAPDLADGRKRLFQALELATGGKGDPLTGKTHAARILDHNATSEYVPELLPEGTRQDLKPLGVVQPDGPSFTVTDGNLIQWQKWSMRATFNSREGAVLHDIRYDGRSILYRLSMSDMTVPYADARPPFHRKQAFDFGDGGLGHCVNNLALGCDCLGVIKYFDGVLVGSDGTATETKNVICLHEQDNGIGWKHTNWRTGRAVVTRRRELVVQFIITLANYEYAFNFIFDQAAGITVESRATGIVSVVHIDEGKTSDYGNVVSPGVLAQNHQHVFCVRIDPAIDGHKNTVVQEESLPVRIDKRTNPNGNFYEIRKTEIATSVGLDAAPHNNRVFKVQNHSKLNPISGRPVGYKLTPPPTQLLLSDPNCTQSKRALFARHHLWVTKYKDHELYAGGKYTLQSSLEVGGVSDAAARNDDVLDEDLVLWSVFGLTHNSRVEDWPVMPVEIMQLHITPSDFFTRNPAIDVPSNKDLTSKQVMGEVTEAVACCKL
ncbi:copper amine oxidase 1 [Apiospora marii]|uniref:Amine oxidase n=1 Tax=Apiospora marii TaxID=335849 RepID=A0ABR1RT16_9PEZI